MKQEHQVESFDNCINELQQQAYAQRLDLENAHHGHVETRAHGRRIKPKAPTMHDSSELFHVDNVFSNVRFHQSIAMLYVFDDNEAVIKMIFKGRSPIMRHVSRTHRVSLDWLFDRTTFGPQYSNQIH